MRTVPLATSFPTVDTAQKERFRKLLIEQRDQVVAGLDSDDPAENQDLRDPEEFATVITSSEVNDQLMEDDLNLLQKIDLALSRRVPMSAGTVLEVRAEAFNVTNTTQFGAPNGSFGSAAFGTITTAADPRVIQVAVKVIF